MRFILIISFFFCSNLFAQTKDEINELLNSEAFRASFSAEDLKAAQESLKKMDSKQYDEMVNKAKEMYKKDPSKFQNAVDFSQLNQ